MTVILIGGHLPDDLSADNVAKVEQGKQDLVNALILLEAATRGSKRAKMLRRDLLDIFQEVQGIILSSRGDLFFPELAQAAKDLATAVEHLRSSL